METVKVYIISCFVLRCSKIMCLYLNAYSLFTFLMGFYKVLASFRTVCVEVIALLKCLLTIVTI